MWAPPSPYRVGQVPRDDLPAEWLVYIEQLEAETGDAVKVWGGRDGDLVVVRFPPP